MRTRFTIVGGRGFIGRTIAASLRERGDDVRVVRHAEEIDGSDGGVVIYASGIAASTAPDASYAFEVHVEGVRRWLTGARFDAFVYLSSTRVYDGANATREDASLCAGPASGNDVYRISKIAGEALCLAADNAAVRVVRMSNVAGPSFRSSLFLSDVLRQAALGGPVRVRSTPDSARDYIAIDDVVRYVLDIAASGRERIYNIACGQNVENGALYDALRNVGVQVEVARDAARAVTPEIAVDRIQAEFGPCREPVLAMISPLLSAFRAELASSAR